MSEAIKPEVVKFKAFCLERYKYARNLTGREALSIFRKFGVMKYIGDYFDVLHTFGAQYIVSDIDAFIEERR
ncbi:MAG: DUF3791 domain-containing protein [Firmicutes bacterium]|nr:DUF3791 domain-containing protein [Bacillota bacterium]